jgi:hypothetical protein
VVKKRHYWHGLTVDNPLRHPLAGCVNVQAHCANISINKHRKPHRKKIKLELNPKRRKTKASASP